MSNYIDGFLHPIPKKYLNVYKQAADSVGQIWKEHGALAYCEYVLDDPKMEGLPAFPKVMNAKKDEVILFGWVVFSSKIERNEANKKVAHDPRMTDLIAPLTNSKRLIFDASRMVYGGFELLVNS